MIKMETKTQFKNKYLKECQEAFQDVSVEDLEFWIECRISEAIDKAYKLGRTKHSP